MSRVVWLDCSVGVAGDMLLAALIDAGASEERVRSGLATLGLTGWSLHLEEATRGAFRALRASVKVAGVEEGGGPPEGAEPSHGHAHGHGHGHAHGHGDDADADASVAVGFQPTGLFVPDQPARTPHFRLGHGHSHDHGHGDGHAHSDAHGLTGRWSEIRSRITAAALPPRAKERALAAYGRLAEAEAKLHGVPVDEVVLHEVGSVDAVIDVVGVCLALEDLGAERIVATPLPMGTGRVNAAHGAIPLPAPATLGVLIGWPCVPSAWPGEWVTPTGAALVAALATPGPMPAMTPISVGYGAGRRDPPQVANLVRAVVGEVAGPLEAAPDAVIELSCNLDDMTGELVAPLLQRLLDEGALDAWAAPIVMKKGRPALLLSVLARPADADRLGELVLRHSTTLGIRRHTATRQVLDRWVDTVETPYGPVRMKVGGRDGDAWHAAPELEDVARAAQIAGVPLHEVHRAAVAGWSPVRGR